MGRLADLDEQNDARTQTPWLCGGAEPAVMSLLPAPAMWLTVLASSADRSPSIPTAREPIGRGSSIPTGDIRRGSSGCPWATLQTTSLVSETVTACPESCTRSLLSCIRTVPPRSDA